ncbi:MAG TPA: hypothetical protein VFW65_29460 [Pseudonocardiaceae bacterium]|nr:hypothetical protein [Pseudonocardiaceae bacterium]
MNLSCPVRSAIACRALVLVALGLIAVAGSAVTRLLADHHPVEVVR